MHGSRLEQASQYLLLSNKGKEQPPTESFSADGFKSQIGDLVWGNRLGPSRYRALLVRESASSAKQSLQRRCVPGKSIALSTRSDFSRKCRTC